MTREKFGTVAALQYAKRPKLDFATIVKEFDNSFQLIEGQERSQTWICRDIVMIDRDVVRVAMGWLNPFGEETGQVAAILSAAMNTILPAR